MSNQPASQNIPHAAQNAKEEASAVASTIAQGIAGKGGKGEFDAAAVTRTQDATGQDHSLSESFVSATIGRPRISIISCYLTTYPEPHLIIVN